MTDSLYIIDILWRDSENETTIICPDDMVFGIFEGLPKFIIERIRILPKEDLLWQVEKHLMNYVTTVNVI